MQRTLSCPYLLGRTRPSREACAFAGAESSCSRRYLSPDEAVPRCPRPAWSGRGDGLGLGSSVHMRGGAPGRGHAVGPGPAGFPFPSWLAWILDESSPLLFLVPLGSGREFATRVTADTARVPACSGLTWSRPQRPALGGTLLSRPSPPPSHARVAARPLCNAGPQRLPTNCRSQSAERPEWVVLEPLTGAGTCGGALQPRPRWGTRAPMLRPWCATLC